MRSSENYFFRSPGPLGKAGTVRANVAPRFRAGFAFPGRFKACFGDIFLREGNGRGGDPAPP